MDKMKQFKPAPRVSTDTRLREATAGYPPELSRGIRRSKLPENQVHERNSYRIARPPEADGLMRRRIKKLSIIILVFTFAASCSLNPFGGVSSAGGMLKSSDSGDSWELKSRLEDGSALGSLGVARTRLDPSDKNRLYLASFTKGVYQSSNAGDNWKNVLTGSRIYDLQINPTNGQEVYAGGTTGNAAKLFKTQDGGATWTVSFSQSSASAFVSAVALVPGDSKAVVISLSTGEILRSVNSGTSWDLLKPVSGRVLKIFASGINSNVYFALSRREGLYRSTDAGASWTKLSLPGATGQFLGGSQTFEDFTLADSESVIYLVGSAGVFRSRNLGNNWEK
ncbi:MAG: hypothetical protein AAB871_01755, partial [Patescibacteria group bacterium]